MTRFLHRSRFTEYRRMRRRPLALLLLVLILSGCASTQAPATEAERVAAAMRKSGLELTNLRPIRVPGRSSDRIVENLGFDIPGITLPDEPAGTIRIYKGKNEAESERRLYALLGQPGPQTKLDYVTVNGTRGLLLYHQIPPDIAQRYINAFTSSP